MLLTVGSEDMQEELRYAYENLNIIKEMVNGQPRLQMYSSGGPLDDYETCLWHCIYTTKWWKHKSYDPVWDYGQVQSNNASNEDDLTGNDVLELIACKDLPDININLIEDPIQSEGLLTSILQKLRSQKGKTDWSKVSTTSLYVHHLDCAESIAKSFYTKELDIISSF